LPSNLPIDGHSFRRVEVLTGAPRRRRWSAAEKAAIVAESLVPGAVASTIALRHGLHRNQLYMWRRELRSGALGNRGIAMPDFVPIVPESRAASRTAAIEIEIGGAVSTWRFSARSSVC
jgi:transposase